MVVAGVIMVMVGAELSNELLDFMDHGRAGASGLIPLFHGLWGLMGAQVAVGGLILILFLLGAMLFARGRSLGTSTAEEWVDEQRQAEALAREQAAMAGASPAAAAAAANPGFGRRPRVAPLPVNAQPVVSRRSDNVKPEEPPARLDRVNPTESSRATLSSHAALTMRQFLVLIAVGIGAIAIGIYEYYDLLAFETRGGSRKVHTVIKLLYEIGGKWSVLGFFVAAGVAALGYAGFKLARKPRDGAQTA